jgi:hypothetical protein
MRNRLKLAAVALLVLAGASALATPIIDSAVLNLRLWNDDPDSVLSSGNLYPGSIFIQDLNWMAMASGG